MIMGRGRTGYVNAYWTGRDCWAGRLPDSGNTFEVRRASGGRVEVFVNRNGWWQPYKSNQWSEDVFRRTGIMFGNILITPGR